MEKLIITVAPTGNVPTRQTNPYLPITPVEIAEDIYRCYQAGAAIAHLHARNEAGEPTADVEVFAAIAERVRQKCDMIIQFSTGARAGKTAVERGACIELKPEMASLTTCSSNFANAVNFNPPDLIMDLASKMNQHGVKPEIEVFDLSALEYAGHLVKKKIIKEPLHINLVLGVPGSMGGAARNLFFLVESLPENCTWCVTAIGKAHRQLSALGLALGGHVRTGLEDLNELEAGIPVSNLQLVQRVAALAKAYDRQIASPDEARKIISLL